MSVPSPLVMARPVEQFACSAGRRLAYDTSGTLWEWEQMGNLFSRPMPAAFVEGVTALAAGHEYSLAVRDDGSVWMWGDVAGWGLEPSPDRGLVRVNALEGTTAIAANQWPLFDGQSLVAVGRDGGLLYWRFQDPAGPLELSLPRPATAVAMGAFHALALTDDGRVWSWGLNDAGQLGVGDLDGRETPTEISGLSGITAIAADLSQSYALDGEGRIWQWGSQVTGYEADGSAIWEELVAPARLEGIESVVSIRAGWYRLFAATADGALWARGDNSYGRLGDGTWERRDEPVRVIGYGPDAPPLPLPPAPAISIATEPGAATLTVEADDLRDGLLLYYAPYPGAEEVRVRELGDRRVTRFELPSGSAYYAGVLIDDRRGALGLSPLSNVEHFVVP